MTLKDTIKEVWDAGVTRTLVPLAVAAIVAFGISVGIPLDPTFAPAITAFLSTLSGAVYWYGARIIEKYKPHWSKWLLLSSKQPTYSVPPGPTAGEGAVTPVGVVYAEPEVSTSEQGVAYVPLHVETPQG